MSPKARKLIKIPAIVLVAYIAIVVLFETLLGFYQPANQSMMIITTYGESGEPHPRVVARLESGEELYVAANHWPRAWYRQAIANPRIDVEGEGITGTYTAVPLAGAEFDRINAEHALGPIFRFITGFPPRRLLRLEPQ